MADQKLIEEVGKYIDKYYKPAYSDIKMDKEMLSVFEKITKYREKRAEEKRFSSMAGNISSAKTFAQDFSSAFCSLAVNPEKLSVNDICW